MNQSIQVFDKLALKYDRWFEENQAAYAAEVSVVRSLLHPSGAGLEIGVGTGRFALPCGIKTGVEPAPAMAEIARQRGITVYEARQTIFAGSGDRAGIQPVREGTGEGLFVVLAARKRQLPPEVNPE